MPSAVGEWVAGGFVMVSFLFNHVYPFIYSYLFYVRFNQSMKTMKTISHGRICNV